ncbi:hypothetical protein [Flavobacterium sp. UMI-01]|uniref:hypothetical protein n=1 Tax=Flavobacterium sp. UMI-01 TaxID=1441053 RepID=UPI001C7DB525|nr:hypothetical protein [Flavobacterium sp. UMI-01]GIZ08962.1 hypothetical protein FUMI01_16890 [Flavobacterium sp. UMI-01]
MKTRKIILATLLVIGLCISCDSNDKTTDNTPLTEADLSNETKIDAAIEDVSNIAEDQYAAQQTVTSKSSVVVPRYLPDCAEIKTNTTNDSHIRTIDFGTTGCTLKNGNVIKGKITISFSKSTTDATKTIAYTLENFYHNGNLITGNKSLVISKLNTTKPVVTHTLDMTITFANGNVYTRTGTIMREFSEGYTTPGNWEDNVLSITGNTSTTLPTGAKITKTITAALIVKASCKIVFPVKGTMTIVKNGSEGVVDFGDGSCDKLATFTFKGIPIPFELKN